MRAACLMLALALSAPLAAQEEPVKKKPVAAKKKPAAMATKGAHKKPTAEQIRKFEELEKKQQ